jgi:hypothetical protein
LTDGHVEIARMLINHGASVDDTVVRDHEVEMMLTPQGKALRSLLLAAVAEPLSDP